MIIKPHLIILQETWYLSFYKVNETAEHFCSCFKNSFWYNKIYHTLRIIWSFSVSIFFSKLLNLVLILETSYLSCITFIFQIWKAFWKTATMTFPLDILFQLKILNWIEQGKRPHLVTDVNETILKHQTVPLIIKHFFCLIHKAHNFKGQQEMNRVFILKFWI